MDRGSFSGGAALDPSSPITRCMIGGNIPHGAVGNATNTLGHLDAVVPHCDQISPVAAGFPFGPSAMVAPAASLTVYSCKLLLP